MPKPIRTPKRKPKPKPRLRKPPKSEAEKEKARKRAALIRRTALLTLFIGFSGIFLYNNRDYFMPALEKYSVYDLLPKKNEKTERLKAAKRAEVDSVKAVRKAAVDSIKAMKRDEAERAVEDRAERRAVADSIDIARETEAGKAKIAKAARKAAADSVRAAAKTQSDSIKIVRQAEAEIISAVKKAAADSLKIVRKAEVDRVKTERAERKRAESAKAKQPDKPKEARELKSLDEIIGGPEFVGDTPQQPKPELPYGLPETAKAEPPHEAAPVPAESPPPYYAEPEPAVTWKTEAAAAREEEPVAPAYAEVDSVKPAKAKHALQSSAVEFIEIAKNFAKEKAAAFVNLVNPKPAQTAESTPTPPPPSKTETVKLAKSEPAPSDTPARATAAPPQPAKPEFAASTKQEPVKTARPSLEPPPKPDALKIDEPNIALPPPETESAKKEAKPPAPAVLPEDTFYLSNIPCKLADRDDLTIYLTAELIFNGEPIRQEIIFKRGALTAVAGNVVRGHEYGNVSTAKISKDLLTAFNDILLAGDLNRVDVKDFRVEPNGR